TEPTDVDAAVPAPARRVERRLGFLVVPVDGHLLVDPDERARAVGDHLPLVKDCRLLTRVARLERRFEVRRRDVEAPPEVRLAADALHLRILAPGSTFFEGHRRRLKNRLRSVLPGLPED